MSIVRDKKKITDAETESNEIFMFERLNIIKINIIAKDYDLLPKEKSFTPIEIKRVIKDGIDTVLIEKEEDVNKLKRQTYRELLFLSGVSIFEMCCKDWFSWGLKHSNKLLEYCKDKNINILEILKSDDIEETVISNIVEDIKFMDTKKCEEEFKKIFGLSIFEDREERYGFQKHLDRRHLFAHNSSFIDAKYIKKTGLDKDSKGKILNISDKDTKEFLKLLDKITVKIAVGINNMIMIDLQKKEKNGKKSNENLAVFFNYVDKSIGVIG